MERHPARPASVRVLLALPLNLRFGRDVARGVAQHAEEVRWVIRATMLEESAILPFLRAHPDDFAGVIGAFGDPHIMRQLRERLPAVNVSSRTRSSLLPRVIINDAQVGRAAAEYLLTKGYRHFAVVRFGGHEFSRQRACSFREALATRRLPCAEYNWAEAPLEEKLDRCAEWVRALPRPVAIFATNDTLAQNIVQTCREAHVAVPEEAAIVGVDDDETESWLAGIPLSSVRIPFETLGRRAAELLAHLMAGGAPPDEPIRIAPLGVVERRSSDVMAVDDPQLEKALRYALEAPRALSTVRAAASFAGLSVRALQYRCHQRLHRSFHEIVLEARLQRARHMLADTHRSVAEIAEICGFGGAPQFIRRFRRRYGVSPLQWRRNIGLR